MKTIRFFNPGKQYLNHKKELDKNYKKNRVEGSLILQKEVEDFEKNIAEFVGTKYAVGVNSGTDALFLSLKLLGIKPGDEVITVGHTFHATVEVIHHCGATPILVDVGIDSLMDVEEVKKAITPKTKAIIPVHLMGDMCDMKAIMKLARKHKLVVVEDACQALGAERDGKKAGAWGDTGCFSHYPAKILGCPGDGGTIVTNNKKLAMEFKDLRNHYKFNPGKYGYNSRLDNVWAGQLNVMIKHLPEMLERRREIAEWYDSNFDELPMILPTQRKGRVYQDYIIQVEDVEKLKNFLENVGIGTMRNNYHFPDDLPKPKMTIDLENHTLRLPCNDVLLDKEVRYIIKRIFEFYG